MMERDAGARGLPVTVVIVASLSGLAILAVTLVSLAGFQIAQRNTIELTRDKATMALDAIETRIRAHLQPVETMVAQLAANIAEGRIKGPGASDLEIALLSAVSATPQVSVVGFVEPELSAVVVLPNRPGKPVRQRNLDGDLGLVRAMERARVSDAPFWGDLYYAESVELAFLNLYAPVFRDGAFLGIVAAGISIQELSEYLSEQGDEETDIFLHAFVLHDRNQVLAHALLASSPFPGRSDDKPLPEIGEFSDPVLQNIWNPDLRVDVDPRYRRGFEAHGIAFAGVSYVFIYRELHDFGEAPWVIGTYQRADDVASQAQRLELIPMVSAAIVLIALILAFILGRTLSRPLHRLAAAANRVRALELGAVPTLSGGPYREVNDAATAFNSMVAGLRSFETYVPRDLVRELIERHGKAGVPSEERELTVLFSDIAGFTAMAENLPASEIAGFLNEHFTLVGRCIQAEEGTIDKYIGDGLMAFWGAPLPQDDTAQRACRAALSIAAAIGSDNRRRRAEGLPPVRLRIGIHTGPVVVGNIGLAGRINYTVVGDTVNACQRLESLSKEVGWHDEEPVSILISSTTASHLAGRFDLEPVGRFPVKGREQEIEVYRLHTVVRGGASR